MKNRQSQRILFWATLSISLTVVLAFTAGAYLNHLYFASSPFQYDDVTIIGLVNKENVSLLRTLLLFF